MTLRAWPTSSIQVDWSHQQDCMWGMPNGYLPARRRTGACVKNPHDAGAFYSQLLAYVESGFPLFAELERVGHAVAIIGHTGFGGAVGKPAPCHFAYDTVSGLVVVDDNLLPYHTIPRPAGTGDDYGCDDVTAFIVPLPEKIYYPAEYADNLAIILATEKHLGFDHESLANRLYGIS